MDEQDKVRVSHACRVMRATEIVLGANPLAVRCMPEDGGCNAGPGDACIMRFGSSAVVDCDDVRRALTRVLDCDISMPEALSRARALLDALGGWLEGDGPILSERTEPWVQGSGPGAGVGGAQPPSGT